MSKATSVVQSVVLVLDVHPVSFFRKENHLDDQSQEAFAHLLCDPIAHPAMPVRDCTHFLLALNSTHGQRANSWHTDIVSVDAYPEASILRSVFTPASGGRYGVGQHRQRLQ